MTAEPWSGVCKVCTERSEGWTGLARLARSQLSESRQQLIFNYKLAFEHQT